MNCRVEEKREHLYFSDLKGGDVFVSNVYNVPRIKLNEPHDGINAVELRGGAGFECNDELRVTLLECEEVVFKRKG